MSLASRLSWFFLAALALVLAGFSATLYALAHSHLYRQQSERLHAALNTLVAAAEIESGAVEWEPRQRLLDVSPVLWEVADGNGQRIDGSGAKNLLQAVAGEQTDKEVAFEGQRWDRAAQECAGRETGTRQRGEEARRPEHHRGRSSRPGAGNAALAGSGAERAVRGIVGGGGGGGALAGLRGLRPLTDMARSARAISAVDLTRRLPVAATADELDELGNAFNDLLSRLEESFARQQRFTGDASHQLRTPLTAMLGQVEVALRRDLRSR